MCLGFVAQRYGFCIVGALLEALVLRKPRQILGVAAAMLVFGLVHLRGYQHGADAGAWSLAGGLLQGVGYYLASGCTLSLLLHLGEGSKFHAIALAGFIVGMAAYVGLA
jgi:uncharacterized membrane protein YedE/YeeE